MEARSRKRQIERAGPLSSASAGSAGEGAAAAAAATSSEAAASAVSDLWPLSPRFPGPALQLVRSKMTALTLSALRLVNRSARADFVDGFAARVWRHRWDDPPLAAIVGAAPRLRSLASLSLRYLTGRAECLALADALERLPGGGAPLRALDLGEASGHAAGGLGRLAVAVGRLSGLTSFAADLQGRWNDGAAALVNAVGRLPVLAQLRLRLACHFEAGQSLQMPPLATLRRLEALELVDAAAVQWLPSMFAAENAAALTRLRDLSVGMRSAACRLPPAPWRAPWMSQLSQFAVWGHKGQMQFVSRALTPGTLPALRALDISTRNSCFGARLLRRFIAACDAAALQTLALDGVAGAAVRDVAASLPALRALELVDADFTCGGLTDSDDDNDGGGGGGGGAFALRRPGDDTEMVAFCAFLAAPLAPLTRLTLRILDNALAARLSAFFASGRASALREVALHSIGDAGDPDAPSDTLELRSLRGLSALTALTKLAVQIPWLKEAALVTEARTKACRRWAPRLREFELETDMLSARTLQALLLLPFERIERLSVRACCMHDLCSLGL